MSDLYSDPANAAPKPAPFGPVVDNGTALAAMQAFAAGAGRTLEESVLELRYQIHQRSRATAEMMAAARAMFGAFYHPQYRVVIAPQHMRGPVEGEVRDDDMIPP